MDEKWQGMRFVSDFRHGIILIDLHRVNLRACFDFATSVAAVRI
jgi:hypothetical protein